MKTNNLTGINRNVKAEDRLRIRDYLEKLRSD